MDDEGNSKYNQQLTFYFSLLKLMKKFLERKQSLKRKSRRKKRRRKQLLKSKTSISRKNTLKKSFRYLIKNFNKVRLPSNLFMVDLYQF